MSDYINELVEIKLKKPDDFLKVKETLERIGIASKQKKILYQSCHIFHKTKQVLDSTGRVILNQDGSEKRTSHYYIVHFKELFKLDGKETDISEDDIGRRNSIINMLEDWGLIACVDKQKTKHPLCPISQIKIISYKDKPNWMLSAKYNIGKKKAIH